MSGAITFRLRRVHYDAIASGKKKGEVRRANDYWKRVAAREPKIAVFVAPDRPTIRHRITSTIDVPSAAAALGRKLRPGEAEDLGDGRVFLFVLEDRLEDGQFCVRCGCTEDTPCTLKVDSYEDETCYFIEPTPAGGRLCNFCAGRPVGRRRRQARID